MHLHDMDTSAQRRDGTYGHCDRDEFDPNQDQGQANGAIIVGMHRYLLWRTWDTTRPRHLWVLLNPSTADATSDDPTLRRCAGFSRDWGYGGLEMVNLFALRATDPRELLRAEEPIGSENDRYIAAAAARAAGIVVAWGARGTLLRRDQAVLALLSRHAACPLHCLGTTRKDCPRHPLYVARVANPVPYHTNVG